MASYYQGRPSDHFDGTHFFNPDVTNPQGAFAVLRWKLTSRPGPWPSMPQPVTPDKPPPRMEGMKLRATLVGHATALLQTAGLNIVTDPVWSERASPFTFIGPKRVVAPGIGFNDLPRIDVIVLSHNHYDHLDIETLKRLVMRDNSLIVTPLGNDTIIRRHIPAARIVTLDWGQSHQVGDAIFHCRPAQHWSSRSGFDRDLALWGAFVISTPGGKIYFAADSGYHTHFKDIAAEFGPLRLALIPIGAYEPRWFMRHYHMNPADAVEAFEDLGRPRSLAIHHDVFQLADEAYGAATRDLDAALKAKGLEAAGFDAPPPGYFIELN